MQVLKSKDRMDVEKSIPFWLWLAATHGIAKGGKDRSRSYSPPKAQGSLATIFGPTLAICSWRLEPMPSSSQVFNPVSDRKRISQNSKFGAGERANAGLSQAVNLILGYALSLIFNKLHFSPLILA
jgi:hypothetical protein